MLRMHLEKVICLILIFLKNYLKKKLVIKVLKNQFLRNRILIKTTILLKPRKKIKRIGKVWVEKGSTYSRNPNIVICFLLHEKGSYFK